jgi:hypothetical protein
MSKDTRDLISLGLLFLLVVSWVSFAGYSVWKDRELKRNADAFQKRVAERIDLGRWEGEI